MVGAFDVPDDDQVLLKILVGYRGPRWCILFLIYKFNL